MNKLKLQALVEKARKNHATRQASLQSAKLAEQNGTISHIDPGNRATITEHVLTADDSFHKTIPGFDYNEKQMEAIELAMRAKSFNLIGAAGTGKTTTTREVIGQLVKLPHITPLQESTKWLAKESPGIVVISFTNKAVNNLKKFLPEELKRHCLTYHKLLQYEPVIYELEPGNPAGKKTMRFEPSFGPNAPLPHISCIIIEESSMVPGDPLDRGSALHSVLRAALPNPDATQFIFLGDLNQLPPIFGPSVLGFKLLDLQTVELTHVYRQALESPIITLAHKIREGRGFSDKTGRSQLTVEGFVDDRGEHGKVTIHPWKKKQESGNACKVAQGFLIKLMQTGKYNVDEDIILCPFNKSFGTLELNKSIANYLGQQRGAEVFEVIARYQKNYWAVGDRVLVDRMEAKIIRIEPTPGYSGPVPASSSKTLDRWGRDSGDAKPDEELSAADAFNILDSLVVGNGDEEQTKNSASHTVTIEFLDTGTTKSFSDAGNLNSMLFSYVLTVHKSQGSEWKRVFILLHSSHNSMLSRELLYTAVTRARHELFIICEPDKGEVYNSITRAAKNPEIHGVTLKEKAAYFTRKAKEMVSKTASKKGNSPEQQEIVYEEDA
jgi:ATP-dependent exoDNAse (exonuclease V) alpha subunit